MLSSYHSSGRVCSSSIIITFEERAIIEREFLSSSISYHTRKSVALLARAEDYSLRAISTMTGYCENTLRTFYQAWNQVKFHAFTDHRKGNQNASKLTLGERSEIHEILHNETPVSIEYTSQDEPWSVNAVQYLLRLKYGITYSSRVSYENLLKENGYSWKLPSLRDKRKHDDETIHHMMNQLKERVSNEVHEHENVSLYYADEVRVESKTRRSKAWLRDNDPLGILPDYREHQEQSYLGFLHYEGRLSMHSLPRGTSENVLVGVRELLKQDDSERVIIIWDNAASHRSKLLKKALREEPDFKRLLLLNLPPYSPEHNPIEKAWATLKRGISNKHYPTYQDKINDFQEQALKLKLVLS